MISWPRALAVGSAIAAGGAVIGGAAYVGLVTGAVPIDLGIGRRVRPLGPLRIQIDAAREIVFAVIAAPYGERVPQSLRQKVRVLEHGTDMVLAAHYTPVRGRLRATTVEVVRFSPPDRIDLRLVRGPVPHVSESFRLYKRGDATTLTYEGELGTDCGPWADFGATLSPTNGKALSRPPSTPSRLKPKRERAGAVVLRTGSKRWSGSSRSGCGTDFLMLRLPDRMPTSQSLSSASSSPAFTFKPASRAQTADIARQLSTPISIALD
jgi:hypothetical protein